MRIYIQTFSIKVDTFNLTKRNTKCKYETIKGQINIHSNKSWVAHSNNEL